VRKEADGSAGAAVGEYGEQMGSSTAGGLGGTQPGQKAFMHGDWNCSCGSHNYVRLLCAALASRTRSLSLSLCTYMMRG
jgi:hypothetical protein